MVWCKLAPRQHANFTITCQQVVQSDLEGGALYAPLLTIYCSLMNSFELGTFIAPWISRAIQLTIANVF